MSPRLNDHSREEGVKLESPSLIKGSTTGIQVRKVKPNHYTPLFVGQFESRGSSLQRMHISRLMVFAHHLKPLPSVCSRKSYGQWEMKSMKDSAHMGFVFRVVCVCERTQPWLLPTSDPILT